MVNPKYPSTTGRIASAISGFFREQIVKRFKRSPQWSKTRKKFLKENPTCAACGGKRLLQVHHILPFDDRPDLELDPNNLITLCMAKYDCHLHIGHGGNYRFYNPDVVAVAAMVRISPRSRIRMELEAAINRRDKP